MAETSIEWTDKVWNPVSGCAKVSQGCKNCYAEAIAKRFWGDRKFTDVQCHEDRLDAPLRWRKPCRIFVNSMSDLFHENVPLAFIGKVIDVMAKCPQHTFQVLTKRPERMLDFMRAERAPLTLRMYGGQLPNVWLGVSVEDQKTADERIPLLLQTPAAVRWVSYEPALGPVDFTAVDCGGQHCFEGGWPSDDDIHSPKLSLNEQMRNLRHGVSRIDWLVVGGESGPSARPMHPDWARSVRDQCVAAGVAFFFKQWGAWKDGSDIRSRQLCVYADGRSCDLTQEAILEEERQSGRQHNDSRSVVMSAVGKQASGRLLDGREWNEYPSVDLA